MRRFRRSFTSVALPIASQHVLHPPPSSSVAPPSSKLYGEHKVNKLHSTNAVKRCACALICCDRYSIIIFRRLFFSFASFARDLSASVCVCVCVSKRLHHLRFRFATTFECHWKFSYAILNSVKFIIIRLLKRRDASETNRQTNANPGIGCATVRDAVVVGGGGGTESREICKTQAVWRPQPKRFTFTFYRQLFHNLKGNPMKIIRVLSIIFPLQTVSSFARRIVFCQAIDASRAGVCPGVWVARAYSCVFTCNYHQLRVRCVHVFILPYGERSSRAICFSRLFFLFVCLLRFPWCGAKNRKISRTY